LAAEQKPERNVQAMGWLGKHINTMIAQADA
jgi:hypothetical protein